MAQKYSFPKYQTVFNTASVGDTETVQGMCCTCRSLTYVEIREFIKELCASPALHSVLHSIFQITSKCGSTKE